MENIFRGTTNRILQSLARSLPGACSLRVWLHRMRGVKIGNGVWISLDCILETCDPHLINIGNDVGIGVRTVMIAHFRGMEASRTISSEPSIRIHDDAYIGPGVIILPNVTIGRGAVVTAGSVVVKSLPPLTMARGNPAKPIAKCGIPLKRGTSYRDFVRKLRPL